MITETWLKDTEKYRSWITGSALNAEPYTVHTVNRPGLKLGGCLALVIKSCFKVKLLNTGHTEQTEYGLWSVKLKNMELTFLGLYHLPGSNSYL